MKDEQRVTMVAYHRVGRWLRSLQLPPALDFAQVHVANHPELLLIRRQFHVYQTEQMPPYTLPTLNFLDRRQCNLNLPALSLYVVKGQIKIQTGV